MKATPVARRIAKENNVDLSYVNGSGADGRVRKSDVEAYLASPQAAAPIAFSTTPAPNGPETEVIPTSRLRQAIAALDVSQFVHQDLPAPVVAPVQPLTRE